MTVRDIIQAAAGVGGGPPGEATYIEDVFSTYLYTGNGSTQIIKNGIALGDSNAGGSTFADSVSNLGTFFSSSSSYISTGSFTLEYWVYSELTTRQYITDQGLGNDFSTVITFNNGSSGRLELYQKVAGHIVNQYSVTGLTTNAWHHIAFVRNGTAVTVYVDGVSKATATSSATCGSNETFCIGSYAGGPGYAATCYLSNLRYVVGTAVYTSAFTPPTASLTAIANTVLLTCQADDPLVDNSTLAHSVVSNQRLPKSFGPFTIAGTGEGGLVWVKDRTTTNVHFLKDTEMPANNWLSSNLTDGLITNTLNFSFNSDGFSLNNNFGITNNSALNYASWTFRKAPKFFDVVTYTGNGADQIINHSLESTPGMVIIKRTDSVGDWYVSHRYNFSGKMLLLNSTAAEFSAGITVTNTTFRVFGGSGTALNNVSGATYVAYLFAHDAGGFGDAGDENVISCGSYTGTGTDNNTVTLGYEPQWILIRRTNTTGGWMMLDNMRGIAFGANDPYLQANEVDAEATASELMSLTTTGFALQGAGAYWNASGSTYIYVAIRRGPMKTPTLALEVFGDVAASVEPITNPLPSQYGVLTDMVYHPYRLSSNNSRSVCARLTGASETVFSNSTAGLTDYSNTLAGYWKFDNNEYAYVPANGIANNSGGAGSSPYVAYSFKRAPGFFDVLCFIGNGTGNRTLPHNLGVAPELVFEKRINGIEDWWVLASPVTSPNSNWWRNYGRWNNDSIFVDWGSDQGFYQAPDANNLYIGSYLNDSTKHYAFYMFATLAGISKVGSYTGTGTTLQVDCGFSTGARFVMIKRTSTASSNWYVWDSARGIVAGNDPYFSPDVALAQVTNTDYIDTYSAGFEITSTAPPEINGSGQSFLFLAFA